MKVIEFSGEHVHTLVNGEEVCHMSRNWSICTADSQHPESDFEEVADPMYYNGNEWVHLNEVTA